MTPSIQHLLAELEEDAGAEAAHAVAALVCEYLAETRTGDGPVSTPLDAASLAARFEEGMPVEGRPLADVLSRLARDVLPDVNRLAHPRAMGHQVSAPLAVAVWTEALTAALNQSAAVWEMSPVGTVIETQVVRWLCDVAGFAAGAGGTFTSGGTEATLAGLLAARQAARPDAWRRGVGSSPPVVVCGEHAHYAVARAIGELGIGTDNTAVVPSRGFRMDLAALEGTLDAAAGGRRWDQGLRSVACSRRVDALKVWVALQRYGAAGFGALYDHLCATAQAMYEAVTDHPLFDAVHEPESNILCFRFVGDRSLPEERVDEVNLALRAAYNRAGDGWITTTVLNGRRVLRATIMNPRTTRLDVTRVLDGLAELGTDRLAPSA